MVGGWDWLGGMAREGMASLLMTGEAEEAEEEETEGGAETEAGGLKGQWVGWARGERGEARLSERGDWGWGEWGESEDWG